jgi:hypothetical protein
LLPWILGVALALAVAALAAQVARAPGGLARLPLYDYVAFWSAGRLNACGEDPYDPDRLAALQREASPGGDVLVMWPAPWALTLLAPFSRLDSHVSHLLWVLAQLGVLLVAVDWAWRLLGGAPEQRWVAWLLAFTFLPSLFVLVTGQLGALILLGFVAFLACLRAGREGWAGAALVLPAVKPQLTFLFWVALALWAVQGRRWRLVLGGVLATAAALALPLWENPHLPLDYWRALTQRTQTHSHLSPLPATALRLLLDPGHMRWQFAPLVPGLLWLAWYWRRHRHDWDWAERLPALLFASFLAAPYGAWPFDLVVLLLPLLRVAARLPVAVTPWAALLTGHMAVGLAAVALAVGGVEYFWFFWMTPAVLATCVAAARLAPGGALAPPAVPTPS